MTERQKQHAHSHSQAPPTASDRKIRKLHGSYWQKVFTSFSANKNVLSHMVMTLIVSKVNELRMHASSKKA